MSEVDLDDISALDLHEAGFAGVLVDPVVDGVQRFGTLMACYRIAITEPGEEQPEATTAQAVVIWANDDYRVGLAWGGNADWGDVPTEATGKDDPAFASAVYDAIDDWLNDAEAWEARN
jgi:hypothetical protein